MQRDSAGGLNHQSPSYSLRTCARSDKGKRVSGLFGSHAVIEKLLCWALPDESNRSLFCLAASREILSFRILAIRVVLFTPSLAAAPFLPPTTQLVLCRVARMCALSASASVRTLPSGSS